MKDTQTPSDSLIMGGVLNPDWLGGHYWGSLGQAPTDHRTTQEKDHKSLGESLFKAKADMLWHPNFLTGILGKKSLISDRRFKFVFVNRYGFTLKLVGLE